MLKHGEVNPLSVHGLRQLDWCPPHFTSVSISGMLNEKVITDWLYENLSGRFYIGVADSLSDQQPGKPSFDRHTVVAFELAAEASYFGLFLPEISTNKL